MVPLLLRKEARGGGVAATSWCFVPYGHEAVDGARLAAFRSPPPPLRAHTYKLVSDETLAGRGGSVSRRDHTQASKKRARTRMGAQVRRKNQAYSQPLFGRGGLGERRFSQRSGLSPRISLYRFFGREREGGASLREAASLAYPARSLFPATLRERGSGGEALLLEKRPLPQNLPSSLALALLLCYGRWAWRGLCIEI